MLVEGVERVEGVDGSAMGEVHTEWIDDILTSGIEPGQIDPNAFAEACAQMFSPTRDPLDERVG